MIEEDIKRLAKRITMLIRELEPVSLDMVAFSKPLAAGKFPKTYIVGVGNSLITYTTELQRIQKAWDEIFKEQLELPDLVPKNSGKKK